MGSAWITLIGTLAGTIVGAVAAYVNHTAQWRRQQKTRWDSARREIFARYLGRAGAYHLALRHLAWALRKNRSSVQARREGVDILLPGLLEVKAEVDILAESRTAAAAERLLECLADFNDELYGAESRPDDRSAIQEAVAMREAAFLQARNDFAAKARAALAADL